MSYAPGFIGSYARHGINFHWKQNIIVWWVLAPHSMYFWNYLVDLQALLMPLSSLAVYSLLLILSVLSDQGANLLNRKGTFFSHRCKSSSTFLLNSKTDIFKVKCIKYSLNLMLQGIFNLVLFMWLYFIIEMHIR